jgi:hypothetical protein
MRQEILLWRLTNILKGIFHKSQMTTVLKMTTREISDILDTTTLKFQLLF